MAADALDPCSARPPDAMLLTMHNKQGSQVGFQVPVPSQHWHIIEIVNMLQCFLTNIQHVKHCFRLCPCHGLEYYRVQQSGQWLLHISHIVGLVTPLSHACPSTSMTC